MKMIVRGTVLVVAVTTMALLLVVDTVEGAAVKRSDDPEALAVVVQQLSSQVSSLQAQLTTVENTMQAKLTAVENTLRQLQAADSRKVAFTASIGQSGVHAAPGQIIPFSHVITNVGHAYSANTGAFTVPYDGQYMLFVRVDVSANYRALQISKNGHLLILGHNDVDDYHIFAGGVVTLSAGDEITVTHAPGVVGSVDGGPESIFSGFMIGLVC